MTTKSKTLLAALTFYLVWALGTWFMEGRIETFLRPDAVIDRILYAFIINLLLGVVGGLLLLRTLIQWRSVTREAAGFRSPQRSLISIIAGLALGLGFYKLSGGASSDPIVLINAFSQVFVVSTAEVMVCWAIVAAGLESAFSGKSRWIATPLAAMMASALFGIYHFAHSAPFNTVQMVSFLSAIGLITSLFFFVSRDVYGTIMFHNFLGVLGVVNALAAKDLLTQMSVIQAPLVATAAVTIVVMVAVDYLALYRAPGRAAEESR